MKNIILIVGCIIVCFSGQAKPNGENMVDKNGEKQQDYTIENCINVFSEAGTEVAKSGWFYWFVRESATATGMNLKMSYVDKQIETHPPHQHPEKEIYYIIEGQAEVFLNGKTEVIGPNSSFFCPSNVMHGIKRVNSQPLKYFVIKAGSNPPASQVGAGTGEFTVNNCITRFDEQKAEVGKTGYFFWFAPKVLTGGLNLKMTYVDKLTGTHPPHQHTGEEILFLLEGRAQVFLNGEIKTIGPNTSIYYPDSSLHCIKRVDEQPIRYLVINP